MKKLPTLYHGTVRVNAKSLLGGVRLRIGPVVARAYGTEHRPLFFATDNPRHAVGYVVMALEELKGPLAWKGSGPLPWDEIPEHGAIAVFERPSPSDWMHCPKDVTECEHHSVEPGDWYTRYELKPTRILTGRTLVAFLRRHGFQKPSLRDDLLLKENRA